MGKLMLAGISNLQAVSPDEEPGCVRTGKAVVVGISDQQVAAPPDWLITYALGSCVGICLYDTYLRIGGLSHILLPERFPNADGNIYKFANTAIEALITKMEGLGCLRFRMSAKIAGGANMFAMAGRSIGERNVEMVKSELSRLNIRLLAEDTGANYGRTVEFDVEDGSVKVKTVGRGCKII